jgi:methyl-accepting chemotaxis protein
MKFPAWIRAALGRPAPSPAPYQAGDLKQAISFVIRVFALLLLCYLGTLAWGVYLARQSAQLQKFSEQIYALDSRISTLRDELNSNFLYIPDSMQDYLGDSNAHPSEREAAQILTRMTQLAQDMGDGEKTRMTGEIAHQFNSYRSAFAQITQSLASPEHRDAATSLGPSRELMLTVGTASDALLRAEQTLQQLYELTEKQRTATTNRMYGGVIIGSVMLVLALLGLGLLLSRTRRQANAAMVASVVAAREKEIENDNINNSAILLLQAVSQMAGRDLCVRAPVTQDVVGTVADSINGLAEEMQRVLQGVSGVAEQVRGASARVRSQAQLVQDTALTERQRLARMSGTLARTTEVMVEVAQRADLGKTAASDATYATESALATVDATVDGMQAIRATIAETEKRIKRLGERSQEISSMVNLINTIAERTHVLALNAAMQAAVAGEAGRGFAVVAEEVQRLAESSRQATQQIAGLVGNIQVETKEAIATVGRTIDQVVQGSQQAQNAGEKMRHTKLMTAELVTQVRDIASAAEAQKLLSAQLLDSVQQIDISTEQTAAQIQEQNLQTERLQEAARQLVQAVGVFRLGSAGDQGHHGHDSALDSTPDLTLGV